MSSSRIAIAAVAVLLSFTACGFGSRLQAGVSTSPTPSINPHGITLGEGMDSSAESNSETGETENSGRPTIPKKADGTYDVPNFVDVWNPEFVSWEGETCAPPRRGSDCKVPFYGKVWSNEDDVTILLLAFENGSVEPAAELTIPAGQGLTRIDHWLPYRIGPETEVVAFKTVLRSKAGVPLAESKPYYVPIGG